MEHVKEFFAERAEGHQAVGVSGKRTDIDGHVTGRTQYYADRTFPGMLHLKMVRSPHHHAKILSVDTSEAEKVPGVVRVLTHKDVPKNVYTILCLIQVEPDDEPCLAVDKVRFKGEQIVAVIAESEAAAREAVAKVKVEYEELPAVFDVEEALKPGAPLVNEYHGQNFFKYEGHHCRRVRYGDVEKAFATADHVLEERYQSSPIEHAPTETTGCIVVPDENGRYVCHSNTQALFFTLDNTGADPEHAVPEAAADRRHGRRRFWRQGRRDRRADRVPRLDAHQAAGEICLQPRGGDAGLLAARGGAHLSSRTA